MAELFGSGWHWLIHPVPAPSAYSMLAAFLLGSALVFIRLTRGPMRRLDTWVHELGHAVVALLCGHRVSAIHIHGDGSGATIHSGSGGRVSRLLISASGHLAPAVLSTALVLSVAYGRHHLSIALLLIISVLVLLLSRSLVAVGWTVGIIGISIAVVLIPDRFSYLAVLVVAGVLATTAPWSIAASARSRRRRKNESLEGRLRSDQEFLADLTRIPAGVWEMVLILVCLCLMGVSIVNMASTAAGTSLLP